LNGMHRPSLILVFARVRTHGSWSRPSPGTSSRSLGAETRDSAQRSDATAPPARGGVQQVKSEPSPLIGNLAVVHFRIVEISLRETPGAPAPRAAQLTAREAVLATQRSIAGGCRSHQPRGQGAGRPSAGQRRAATRERSRRTPRRVESRPGGTALPRRGTAPTRPERTVQGAGQEALPSIRQLSRWCRGPRSEGEDAPRTHLGSGRGCPPSYR